MRKYLEIVKKKEYTDPFSAHIINVRNGRGIRLYIIDSIVTKNGEGNINNNNNNVF